MIVVVVVKCHAVVQCAKQAEVFGVLTDRFGVAGAAYVVVEADDKIAGGHHQMQIVRDHKDAAILFVADLADDAIQLLLAVDVHPLSWFVQYQ